MVNKKLLENRLKEISVLLEENYKSEPQIGVLEGIGGIALFFFLLF